MSEDLQTTIKITVDSSGMASGIEGSKRSIKDLGAAIKTMSAEATTAMDAVGKNEGISGGVLKATKATIRETAVLKTEIEKYGTAAFTGFSNIGKSIEQAHVAMAGKGISDTHITAYISALREAQGVQKHINQDAAKSAATQSSLIQNAIADNAHYDGLKRQSAAHNKALADQEIASTKARAAALAAYYTEAQNAELNLIHTGRGKSAAMLTDKGQRLGYTDAEINTAVSGLKKVEVSNAAAFAAANPHIDQLKKNAEAAGTSVKGLSASMRNVPAQFTDIVVSLQGGQNPLTVLLQQGGQLKDMFGGVGNAGRALGGYIMGLVNPLSIAAAAVATLGLAYLKGAAEGEAYNKALILTGNAAGVTAGQLGEMAQSVAKTTGGTIGAAAEALAQIAGAGTIARAQFDKVAATAISMEKVTGVAMSETIKQFAALGKDPVTESAKLNLTTNYLTQSVYAQIVALDEQGRKSEAAALAQSAYADAMKTRIPALTENLGIVEKAWNAVWGASKRAWDGMLNIGREDSLVTKMATDSANVARIQAQILGVSAFATTGGGAATGGASASRKAALEVELIAAQEVLRNAQEMVRMEKRGAEAAGERAKIQADGISATDAVTKSNERASSEVEKTNKALRDYRKGIADIRAANPESSLLDPAKIAATEASIRNSLAKKGGSKTKKGDEFASERAAAKEWERFYLAVTKDALDAEVAVLGLSKAQKDLIDYTRSTGYSGVSTESKLIVINKLNEAIALEQTAKAQKEATKQAEEASKIYAGDLAKISEKILKLNEENAALQAQTEGMLNHSIVVASATTLADLEAAANYGAALATVERARASAIARSATAEEVAGMQEAIDHLTRLKEATSGAAAAGADKDTSKAMLEQAKRLGADAPADPFKDWGSTLKASFGSAADGMVQVLAGMSALSASNATYAKEIELINAAKKAGAAPDASDAQKKNAATAAKSELALIKQTKAAQLDSYASMAGAAKGYFDKTSAGYRVLDGVEKALRTYQLVMSAQVMAKDLMAIGAKVAAWVAGDAAIATSGVAAAAVLVPANMAIAGTAAVGAVATQGMGDPYTAFPRIAAMIGIMAGIGLLVSGGGGGSPSFSTDAFSAQKANDGTGTVFGDSSAQSKSIENSLSALEGMAKPELAFISKMVTLLQGIKDGLQGTTNAILNSGIDLSGADFTGSSSSSGGGIVGAIFGSSSSSTSLTDLGLKFAKQSIEQSIQSINLEKYQTTRTDRSSSGFLGLGSSSSTSYATQFDQIGDSGKLATSLSNIVSKASTLITEAATKLGATPAQLKAMGEVDNGLGKISLKGLKSEEVTALLGSVFSAMTDTMALTVMPELVEFNKTGTGYSETLIRISAATETAGQIIDKLGTKEVALADLRNKLAADTSAELVRQSVMDAETTRTKTADAYTKTETVYNPGMFGVFGSSTKTFTTQVEAAFTESLSGIGDIIKNYTGSDAELGTLYTSLTQARTALVTMGFSADIVGTQLLKGAGGMDALTQGLADYAEGFLSETEQLALKQAAMDDKFKLIRQTATDEQIKALGLTTPSTAAGFKDLVESLKAGGAGSAEMLGKVIVLSAGMKDLTDAMDAAGESGAIMSGLMKDQASLQAELLTAQGDTAGAAKAQAAITAAARLVETKGYSDAELAAYDYNAALRLTIASTTQAATAATASMSVLQRAVDAQRKVVQVARAAAAEVVSEITGVFGTLQSSVKELYGTVDSTAKMQATQGRAFISQALAAAQSTGYLPESKALADAISAAKGGTDEFASQFEKDFAALTLAGDLSLMEALSKSQLTEAERMLQVADDQLIALDGVLELAQKQLDAANGINTSVLSVVDAVNLVNESVQTLVNLQASAADASRLDSIATYIKSVYDNSSATTEKSSLQKIADTAKEYGVSMADIARSMNFSLSDVSALYNKFNVSWTSSMGLISGNLGASSTSTLASSAIAKAQGSAAQIWMGAGVGPGSAASSTTTPTAYTDSGYTVEYGALMNIGSSIFVPVVDSAEIARLDSVQAYIRSLEWGTPAADLESTQQLAEAAAKYGVSQRDLAASMHMPFDDVRKLFSAADIPYFATGGDHLGGLRIVGEHGPELEATGPSRIFNAGQTRSMLGRGGGNTERLEALVETLILKIQNLEAAAVEGNRSNERIATAVHGNPDRPVLVEIAS